MPLRRLLASLCLLTVLLGVSGCGPSEGQNVMMYLGSVTVHERRLQATAEDLEAVVPMLQKTPPEVAAARERVKAALQSVRESSSELKNLHVPTAAVPLSKLYGEAFQVALERLEVLSGALEDVPSAQSRLARQAQLKGQAEALDEQIRQAKIELSKAYPEVQVPEADPPPVPAR